MNNGLWTRTLSTIISMAESAVPTRRFPLVVALSLALALGVAAPTQSIACHKGTPHGKDTACPDPPPPPDPEEHIEYTAELTVGGFDFGGPVDVTLRTKGTGGLHSGVPLHMGRPPATSPDRNAWDGVFSRCLNLLGAIPEAVDVGPDWSIDKSGENDIRIRLRDMEVDGVNADLEVNLIGVPEEPWLPTGPVGTDVEHTLDMSVIYGRSKKGGPGGSQGCQLAGGGTPDNFALVPPSMLKLTVR